METETEETCQKYVSNGWRSYRCGRKIKADGLCGMHLGVKARKEAKEAAHNAERDRSDANLKLAEAVIARLAAFNLKAYPDHSRYTGYTGRVSVDGEKVAELLESYK